MGFLNKILNRRGGTTMAKSTEQTLYKDRADADYLEMLVYDAYYKNDFDGLRTNLKTTLNNWYVKAKEKVTYPSAKKVCAKLSKSVFSEPPKFDVDEESIDRLGDIIRGNNFYTKLRKGCEFGGALGKVYLKFTIDKDMPYPLVDVVYALNAEVTARKWGEGTEATFYTFIKQEGTKQYWLCEMYKEDGTVENVLKVGKSSKSNIALKEVPLETIDETKDLLPIVDMKMNVPMFLEIVSPTVNNKNPNSFDGSSLFANALPQIDAMNRVVHEYYMEFKAKGVKVFYDETMFKRGDEPTFIDKEVFVKSIFDQGLVSNGKYDPIHTFDPPIRAEQFSLGVKDHLSMVYEACELSSASSSQGKGDRGPDKTTVEVESQEKETFETKNDYQVVWKNALEKTLRIFLELDNIHYGASVEGEEGKHVKHNLDGVINVEFMDQFKLNKTEKTTRILAMRKEGIVSKQTVLEQVFEDWDDKRVQKELDRIKEEKEADMPIDLESMFLGNGPTDKTDPKKDEKVTKKDDNDDKE